MAIKTWKDPNGLDIPISRITKQEKKEHRAVERCYKAALRASALLEQARNIIFDEVDETLEDAARYANLKQWKGNGYISNFSDTVRITKNYKHNIRPDNNINICYQIAQECAVEFFKGSKKEAKELMNVYFKLDKSGNYKVENLLELKRAKIDHPRWNEAMKYLDKSLTIAYSKAYFGVEFKDSHGEWHRVPLNFHEIIPDAVKEATKEDHQKKSAA